MRFHALSPGDCMPKCALRTAEGPMLTTFSLGGVWQVICFANAPLAQLAPEVRQALVQAAQISDQVAVLLVLPEPPQAGPEGLRCAFDPDGTAAQAFGALPETVGAGAMAPPVLYVFDPMSRLLKVIFVTRPEAMAVLHDSLRALPPPARATGRPLQAPVLYLPRVFSQSLCHRLIAAHQQDSRALTGVMQHVNGKTVGIMDPQFKRRRDHLIEDRALIQQIQTRIRRAVLPELAKAFGFYATRMERYLVGCYSDHDAGHFAAHRDNTTPATAHRRFAVSINLNEDFEGGDVSFPEFSPDGFKAATGAAVVFGCGLMHRVAPVTRGVRFAFLPFVYDEAAAQVRQANQHSLAG